MLYLLMHFATRIWVRIANLLDLRKGGVTQPVQPTRSCGSHTIAHVDRSMADAWIRQQDRVREVMARAKPGSAPAKDVELDDEWVGPWMRQQQRVRDAIAKASQRRIPASDAEPDDEWVGPWIRQQQRVREAIAQAKRRGSGRG